MGWFPSVDLSRWERNSDPKPDEKPLNRYFPEMIDPLLEQLPKRCVLDGEIVISRKGSLDFDALQLRIHPASSRVKLLSQHRCPPRSSSLISLQRAITTGEKKPSASDVKSWNQSSVERSRPYTFHLQQVIWHWLVTGFGDSKEPAWMESWRREI